MTRGPDAEPSQRLDALCATDGADITCLTLPWIALRAVGRVHDDHLVSSCGVVRQHASSADHLVIGVSG